MTSFNTSTGCFGTMCPPFTTDQQLIDYTSAIRASINSGNSTLKTEASVNISITPDLTNPGWKGATMTASGGNLPSVGVWQIGGSTKAVVYTDAAGASIFSYKNDPGNMIKLVSGGSMIPAASTGGSPAAPIAVTPPVASPGTPWWVWLIVACILFIVLGGAVFMILMKKGSSG